MRQQLFRLPVDGCDRQKRAGGDNAYSNREQRKMKDSVDYSLCIRKLHSLTCVSSCAAQRLKVSVCAIAFFECFLGMASSFYDSSHRQRLFFASKRSGLLYVVM